MSSTSTTADPVNRPEAHVDAAARLRELQRVRDEVVQDLRKPRRIPLELRELRRPQAQLDAFRARGRQRALDALLDDLPEVDALKVERELARVDLGDEEEVVHEPEQPLRVAVGDGEEAALLLVEAGVGEQKLEVAADGRQRRSQLVRHRRDELALEAVELAQPLVLPGQPAVVRLQLPRHTAKNREQREEEREQCQRQDRRQAPACVSDADGDRAVVLVQLDGTNRPRASRQLHRDGDAEHLQVSSPLPRSSARHAPVDLPAQSLRNPFELPDLRSDQRVPGGVGDRSVPPDEPPADDAGNQDVLAEEPVEAVTARSRDGSGEVRRTEAAVEVRAHQCLRLALDRALRAPGNLLVHQPRDCEPRREQHRSGVQSEAQH